MAKTAPEDLSASATKPQDHRNTMVSKKVRRRQVIKICVIAALTILSVSFLIYEVTMRAKQLKRQKELKEHIKTSLKVSSPIKSVQDERTYVTLYLVSKAILNGSEPLPPGSPAISTIELQQKINVSQTKRRDLASMGNNAKVFRGMKSFINKINRLRYEVKNETNGFRRTRISYYFSKYTPLISQLISWLVNNTQNRDDPSGLPAFNMIVQSREEFEIEKALGTHFCFRKENVTLRDEMIRSNGRGEAFLQTSRLLCQALNNDYQLLFEKDGNTRALLLQLETKRREILSSNITSPMKEILSSNITSPMKDASEWFHLMTNYTNLLVGLEMYQAERCSRNIEKIVKKHVILLSLHCLLVFAVFVILPFFIISLVRAQCEFYTYAHSLHHKVDLEQSRTEFLWAENARHMEGECFSCLFPICKYTLTHIINNYSETRDLIDQHPCRMRQSCTGN